MSTDNIVPFERPGITVGGPIDDARVSLSIYGDDLDPDELTQLLGLTPTHSHRRGDRLRPDGPPFQTGCWAHAVESDAPREAAELALGDLLDRLPQEAPLWIRLVKRYRVRILFRIGVTGWNTGFALSARNVRRAAALGVRLEFDLYASEKTPPELLEWLAE